MNRPRMLAILSSLGLAACGVDGGGGGAPVEAPAYVIGVHHAYFPISPGMSWSYVGERDGLPVTEEARALPELRPVLGIACTPVRTEVYVPGALTEIDTELYAEDMDGNVWKFGEEALEFDGMTLTRTVDSWTAGEDGARAWMVFPALPRVGEQFLALRPGGADVFRIASLTALAEVPAGVFADCLEVDENPGDVEDQDIILYSAGVGRVTESDRHGHVDLVAVGRN